MPNSIPDDVYFCVGCAGFHRDDGTHEYVKVPGVDYVTDSDTGKTYKVRHRRAKIKTKPKHGFAKPNLS